MKKLFTLIGISMLLIMAVSAWAGEGSWSIKADYTETCSCTVPCPCSYGSPATRGHCEANSLIEIKEGNMGDINLDGINIAISGRLGSWAKFYVSENATDEQADAAVALLRNEQLFGSYYPESMEDMSVEKASISVEKTDTNIKFSTPFSNVEIEMMKGLNGKPIHVQNIYQDAITGHTQYKSSVNNHKSSDKEFTYEGTNGLTAVISASSGS